MGKPMTRWNGHKAEIYRRSFSGACAGTGPAVVKWLVGRRVADVGCGCGDFARHAAAAGYEVLACDAEPAMVEIARSALAGRVGRVFVDSLPALAGFDDASVDSAVANFVINHVPDAKACLRGLGRITVGGGRIITTTWTADFLPHRDAVVGALDAVGAGQGASRAAPPPGGFERSVAGLAAANEQAGLVVISAQTVTWDWATTWEDYWAGMSGGIGSTGERYLAHGAETRRRVAEQVRDRLSAYEAPGGRLVFPCSAALCVAEKRG
ncbi:bifunctional 2-polyprenyl-6-hydroxyphenol methylase/3-demethylubiquinol 3-O-methyltransferase UbiG [Tessaracoccus sp. OH4464_COT-324]|uniref:class I SAM-dependent methyltransferase n=1 Tax=Tessaracoccus sp. OH4464_COT-324 TaxID=2491059 RepID=UPI000F63DA41|nr:class I SAM-dependent methyltransferase [Tessaracoccus sp. OH4464_COT-324]RRD47135.1 class I SAM-dependent methyltransferase [Tessaracoccus sp. OH4464_COT-324]